MRLVQLRAFPAVLLSVLLLGGCGTFQWVKAGATPEQLSADSTQCQQEAWREARFRAAPFYPGPVFMRDSTGRPIIWRSPFYDPFGDSLMEESRLAQFCMRAKGYRLEKVEKSAAAPADTIQPSTGSTSGGKP